MEDIQQKSIFHIQDDTHKSSGPLHLSVLSTREGIFRLLF